LFSSQRLAECRIHSKQYGFVKKSFMIEDYTNEYLDSVSYITELKEEIENLKKENQQLKEMFDAQTKLVVNLELEKIKLTDKVKNRFL
jgi:cell division septum initiation protein DivIVA